MAVKVIVGKDGGGRWTWEILDAGRAVARATRGYATKARAERAMLGYVRRASRASTYPPVVKVKDGVSVWRG